MACLSEYTAQAYSIVVKHISESELFLDENVAIPSLHQVEKVLKGTRSLEGIGSKSARIKPYHFLASAHAMNFFSETPAGLAAAAECVCEHMHCELTDSPDSRHWTRARRLSLKVQRLCPLLQGCTFRRLLLLVLSL